jgi:hypothetical protein
MRKSEIWTIICAPLTLVTALLVLAASFNPAAARKLTEQDCRNRQDACFFRCGETLDKGSARAHCYAQCGKNRQSCDLLVGTEIPAKSVDDPPTKPPRGNTPRPPTGGLR